MPDITRAYQWAINTCNAPNVGYNQDYRNQKTVDGVTYYDCSSFIWYALQTGGFDVVSAYLAGTGRRYEGNAITTAEEQSWLLALGFVQMPISGEWLPGDVLWRSGHTEMVYTGGTASGVTMGAHDNNRPLANQVSINTFTSTSASWTSLYRYGSGAGSVGPSLYVIAAICGNFCAESTLNPGVWEDFTAHPWDVMRTGYGLGQWTNTDSPNGRLWDLHAWLSANGYADDSGEGQLAYFLDEAYWHRTVTFDHVTYVSHYATLNDFLYSSDTNIAELVREFCYHWEGIPGNQQARAQYAQNFYNYLLAHANDTSVTAWITGNRYLSMNEQYNNAVMLFRYLSAGGGGGGTTGSRKMPVWMMVRPWLY